MLSNLFIVTPIANTKDILSTMEESFLSVHLSQSLTAKLNLHINRYSLVLLTLSEPDVNVENYARTTGMEVFAPCSLFYPSVLTNIWCI